jgi:hypothetical protein
MVSNTARTVAVLVFFVLTVGFTRAAFLAAQSAPPVGSCDCYSVPANVWKYEPPKVGEVCGAVCEPDN